jgi:hypothetical protein
MAIIELSAELADPLLLPVLRQIQAQWGKKKEWPYQLLEDAIVACSPPAPGASNTPESQR